jgi:hypothetical protein
MNNPASLDYYVILMSRYWDLKKVFSVGLYVVSYRF